MQSRKRGRRAAAAADDDDVEPARPAQPRAAADAAGDHTARAGAPAAGDDGGAEGVDDAPPTLYRHTVAGLALTEALAEMPELTREQRHFIWRAFEGAMNESLAQRGCPGQRLELDLAYAPDGGSATAGGGGADDGLPAGYTFPLYRQVGDHCMVILKDVTATVVARGSEAAATPLATLHFDYLRVEGRAEAVPSAAAAAKGAGAAATAAKK